MSKCCWFYLQRHFQNVPWIKFPSHHLHCAHDHSSYSHLQPGWFPRPPLPSDFCPCPQWSEWSCSDFNQIVDPLTAPHHPQRDISTFQSSSCVFMMHSLSPPWPHHLQSPLNQSTPDPVASGFYLAMPATPLQSLCADSSFVEMFSSGAPRFPLLSLSNLCSNVSEILFKTAATPSTSIPDAPYWVLWFFFFLNTNHFLRLHKTYYVNFF